MIDERTGASVPPFSYLRQADLDEAGHPLVNSGEAAREWDGKWYVVDDEIVLH